MTGGLDETRLHAWRALLVTLQIIDEEETLMRYSPHALAIIRSGLKTESNERAAVEALESLSVIIDAGILGIAKEHIHILQEVREYMSYPFMHILSLSIFKKGEPILDQYLTVCSLRNESSGQHESSVWNCRLWWFSHRQFV